MEQTIKQAIIPKRAGLSGSTLKIIAMITMLIDHIGAVVLLRYILNMQSHQIVNVEPYNDMVTLYRVVRGIGRIAFPIYCFLLVEGFQKTRDLKKYILRLGVFALIAEVPFDLAFTAQVFSLRYQSVMLTLLIGVLTMWGVSLLEKHVRSRVLLVLGGTLTIALGAGVAELMNTDYGYMGVLCIMVLYALRRVKWMQILGGCLVFAWEIWAPVAFLPIAFYNGRRGMRLKYVFYLFYPLHLLILYLICVYMGLGNIPAV
ncbi:MAG: conjugal transfer protein TraX [Acetatifactor sp.]